MLFYFFVSSFYLIFYFFSSSYITRKSNALLIHLLWKLRTLTETAKQVKNKALKAIRTTAETPTIPGPQPKVTSKYFFTLPSKPGATIIVSTSPSWEVMIPRSVHAIGQMQQNHIHHPGIFCITTNFKDLDWFYMRNN